MRRLLDLTIRTKLALITTLISTTALLLACAGFAALQLSAFRVEKTNDVTALAKSIAARSAAAVIFDDRRVAQDILAEFADQHTVSAHLYSVTGEVVGSFHRDGASADVAEEPVPTADRLQGGYLFLSKPIDFDGESIGSVALQYDLREMNALLKREIGVAAILLLASAFATFLLSTRLQRVIVRPISDLVKTANLISIGNDYAVRAPVRGRGELRVLIDAFNRMLTQIQQQNASLRENELRLRALTESLPGSIFEADLEYGITYANRVAFEMFGYTAIDLKGGLSILQILVPEDRDRAREFLGRVHESQKSLDDEYSGLRKDGTTFPLEIHTSAIHARGRAVALRGFIIDITNRKDAEITRRNLEDQLVQAQKMEVVGRLAGGVAHDFNNLLTGIAGFTQLALDQLPKDSPIAGDLRQVCECTERASNLTRQLLAFSRRQPLETRVLDLNRVIADVSEMLRQIIGDDVQLRCLAGPDLGAVQADPGQIEQVLMNLVINARDAMPGGGTVTIETSNVVRDHESAEQHEGAASGPYAMISVTDTGCGMDPGTGERIFDPFFTTKDTGKGTGLGLATVHGIVKQHGGDLAVESEPGKGTTFRIYLPCVEKTVVELPPKVESVVPGTETILVVDDDDAVRAVAVRALEEQGYRVIAAAGPDEAEALCAQHKSEIKLLVTDVVMPGYDGRELSRRLAQANPSLKVLFMSGYFEGAGLPSSPHGLGAWFIQKPFSPAALAREVRNILDEEKVDEPGIKWRSDHSA